MHTIARIVVVVVWVLGSLSSLTATPAAGAEARDFRASCPSGGIPPGDYVDVPPHLQDAVDCVSSYFVMKGDGRSNFHPQRLLTRGQAATVIVNLVFAAFQADSEEWTGPFGPFPSEGGEPPRMAPFEDIHHPHAWSVVLLWNAGVVSGTSATRFEPDRPVTRAQFATMLAKTFELVWKRPLAQAASPFDDDDGSPHESTVASLAAVGVFGGTGPRSLEPDRPMTRGQMAMVTSRTIDYLVDIALLAPLGSVPFMDAAAVIVNAGHGDFVDAGDVLAFGFDKPLAAVDELELLLHDDTGPAELVTGPGGNAEATLSVAPMAIEGVEFAPGHAVVVHITGPPRSIGRVPQHLEVALGVYVLAGRGFESTTGTDWNPFVPWNSDNTLTPRVYEYVDPVDVFKPAA